MKSLTTTLLVLTVLLVLLPTETYAFGAGDIPDFAYLNGKAFRHGDIENIIAELAKSVGSSGGGGGNLLDFAHSVLSAAVSGGSGGSKFTKEDVKRVYFGNWLRDYSQCMDIAGLSKLSADTLVLIVSVLGFLTFGFATDEFEVTADRLGVYLPVEHIDNPKGYAEKEGDAREFHPKLRPPVDQEELEVDERTGMKNYMATENRGWDTSTALIRRVFQECIDHGRRARGRDGADLFEAFRLMGTGLHTMEDLLAHSNWCELALRKMGHDEVFCHVGDNVLVDSPNGRTHPLVTGTFGGADFLHSLMGEATDHLSQASVVDLSKKMQDASNSDSSNISQLKNIISKLPIGGDTDDQMNQADDMEAKSKAYQFDPNNVAPPEVRAQLWDLLKWRDGIFRQIIKKIEMVPGLSDLMEELTNALNAFVYTLLAPYLSPILEQVTSVLGEGSKAVIDSDDQYEVFNNPDASDPSHSLLSKDHFALVLNEPAGKIAMVVVEHSVKLIVEAWSNDEDPNRVIDQILEAFHHPYYASGNSRIQEQMFRTMEEWVNGLENVQETIQSLTKEAVREGKNKRQGSDDDMAQSTSVYGGTAGSGRTATSQSYGGVSSYGSSGNQYGSSGRSEGYGESRRQENSYGRQEQSSYGRQDESSYGSQENSYGRQDKSYGRQDNYDNSYGRQDNSYGRQDESSYGRRTEESYSRRTEESSYGRRTDDDYNRSEGYGRQTEEYSGGYGGGYDNSSRREEESGYGSSRRQEGYGGNDSSSGYNPSYAREGGDYGSSRNEYSGSSGYGRNEESGYGGSGGYGRESGYGRSDETYGVEGLSLGNRGDDDDDGRRREHHGHHHHRRSEDD